MCVAAAFAAVSTADGQSYQLASGIALTLIAIGTAAIFAAFAAGLARAKPWTRTPVVMAQLFVVIAGITCWTGTGPSGACPRCCSRPAAWPPCSPRPACAPSTAPLAAPLAGVSPLWSGLP